MARDLKIVFGVFFVTLLALVLVALFVGPNVNVASINTFNSAGSGRYLLRVTSEKESATSAEITRFSVIDTEDGYTYVFNKKKAEHVIPPLDAKQQK